MRLVLFTLLFALSFVFGALYADHERTGPKFHLAEHRCPESGARQLNAPINSWRHARFYVYYYDKYMFNR